MAIINTIPKCFVELSEGEVVVRTYHITTSTRPKSRGDVAITNKRIIYQGKGKTSSMIMEVPIETVSAINTSCSSGVNFGKLIMGIICIIIGIAFIATIFVPIIAGLIGVGTILKSFNSGYSLAIKSAAVSGTGIGVGASDVTYGSGGFFSRLFSTSGQGAVLSVNAAPTKEAIQMMNELGAIVLDLKIMGDRAIAKWQGFQTGTVDTSVLDAKFADAVNLDGIKNVVGKVQKGVQAGIQASQAAQQQAQQQAPQQPVQPPQQPIQQQAPPQPSMQQPMQQPQPSMQQPMQQPQQAPQAPRFTPPPAPPSGFVPPQKPPSPPSNSNNNGGFFG